MGLGEVEAFFIENSCSGLIRPFFTVKTIAHEIKDSPGNVRNYIKTLKELHAIKEHPFNCKMKCKSYRLDLDYFIKNYTIPEKLKAIQKETLEC